ncbi:HPP family protein [Rugamonas sp. CCM 8940]|uniref:HPP family protein n=1 Tax=Rugamonas sp. CCM 8940 TaxID=2765359 RepID=UPI0018F5B46D|nr:HPP family protein [Rugamonas sp. CCM 8940]MBJ7310153.1 HPP family protein [Rugamonas sp. CCM 8940]
MPSSSPLPAWLQGLLPGPNTAGRREQLRAAVGALAGLLLAAFAGHFLLARDSAQLFLVAPIGASAVLAFCLPASPLAQPWSVVGGNVVSGLVGAACVQLFGGGGLAVAGLAVALAIAAMFALRCLHPPGGAVALTAVIGGPAVHAAGYAFALRPVLVDSLLLVVAAVLYNNLSGRRYPQRQQAAHASSHATADVKPTVRLGFTPEDLDAVLRQHNQVLDISRDQLETLFLQTEMRAHQRRFGIIRCADIMSRDVVSAEFATPLDAAWRAMREHNIGALPVLNRAKRVIGIVSQGDFLDHGGLEDYGRLRRQLRNFLRPSGLSHTEKAEVVGQIMSTKPRTAGLDTAIVDLVPLMADSGFHHIPIVDAEQRLAGIVTQSDLVAALYEQRFAEAAA